MTKCNRVKGDALFCDGVIPSMIACVECPSGFCSFTYDSLYKGVICTSCNKLMIYRRMKECKCGGDIMGGKNRLPMTNRYVSMNEAYSDAVDDECTESLINEQTRAL